MLATLRGAIAFMGPNERIKFTAFLVLRALAAILDLAGILAIGLLATSIASSLTRGSDASRTIEVGQFLLPAITAQSLPIFSIAILGLFLSKAIWSIALTQRLAYFLAKIEARSARKIAENAFGKSLEDARAFTKEEIAYAIQIGSPALFNQVLNSIGTIIAEGILFVLIFIAFGFVDIGMAIWAVIYFGLVALSIQRFVGRLMQRNGEKLTSHTVQANTSLADLSDVLREAKVLGKQSYFFDSIFYARVKASRSRATQYVLTGLPRYIVESALIVAIAIFVVFQTINGDIESSATILGVFLTGGLRLTASLLPLQGSVLTIKQSVPDAIKAVELLSKSATPKTGSCLEIREHRTKSLGALPVTLRSLGFTYRGQKKAVLNEISLEIKPGSQVAFIGVSGAGKSTLADLILGILEPTVGEVLIGGVLPEKLTGQQPGLLGYVPQKPGIISGTVEQNIALGIKAEDIDRERLKNSIEASHLTSLIESLPDGVNTELGKRKDELSGGQLQRIGLARALYAGPKLLVLDEATSALDAESENEINLVLDGMKGQVTVILIAHRLNTIQHADTVFVLEKGALSESGSFQELLEKSSRVRNLAKLMSIKTLET